jgi:hypothetical protein
MLTACDIACTSVMVIHKHNVLAARSEAFSVSAVHLCSFNSSSCFTLSQIFFGLAKGFGALTDIIATVAMCLLLVSSRTGISR